MNTTTALSSSTDGMEEASCLVESIRRQLTEGDAPSGNFDNYPDDITANINRNKTSRIQGNNHISIQYSNNDVASVTASEPSMSSSSAGVDRLPRPKQLRFPPRPPSDNAALSPRSSFSNSSFSSKQDMSSLAITYSSSACFTIGSELMGTSALADLCSQTVESISRNSNNHFSSESNLEQPLLQHHHSSDKQKDGTSANFLWGDTDINNMDSFSFEVEDEGESASKKKNSSLTNTPKGKKAEQTPPPAAAAAAAEAAKQRRTVMFGSEYARILSSSSPLSPSSNNGQRSNNARRVKQSIKARAFPIGKKKDELLYVNVKKEPNWDRAVQRPCVTAICVIYPDRNEFVPPGFSVVRYYQPIDDKSADNSNLASPANVNPSNSGERVYLCYRRSREGNPLTGLTCLQPSKGDVIPEGYTVLEKTPRNFLADMTANSDQPLFLAYRQRLENLECLRPLPLVLSVLQSKQDFGRKELKAYYCTGGTVVTSDVGKLHIMDRSTHNILSSSSAQSRLNLIQMAREGSSGSGTAVPSWISSTSTHSSLKNKSEDSIHSFDLREDPTSLFADVDSIGSSPSQRSAASACTPNSKINSPLYRQFDDTVQTSLDSMHFIPSIECANPSIPGPILQSRIAILSPILTACYTSQGGSALVAVEGLTKLLNDTDFFAQDVAVANNIVEASSRLTLIDLAIQVVCDVTTTTSRETYFRSCVDFVSDAVRYANGRLNDRTTGFIMRFYLFVYYFGASVPTSGWPFHRGSDYLLSDDVGDSIVGVYLPGGAPQAAAIALREFVSIMLANIRTVKEPEGYFILEDPNNTEDEDPEKAQEIMNSSKSAESVIDKVDLANYTQLAIHSIESDGLIITQLVPLLAQDVMFQRLCLSFHINRPDSSNRQQWLSNLLVQLSSPCK
eukprot:scaffold9506_cov103-Skeletonema_menzelii.AAC.2